MPKIKLLLRRALLQRTLRRFFEGKRRNFELLISSEEQKAKILTRENNTFYVHNLNWKHLYQKTSQDSQEVYGSPELTLESKAVWQRNYRDMAQKIIGESSQGYNHILVMPWPNQTAEEARDYAVGIYSIAFFPEQAEKP